MNKILIFLVILYEVRLLLSLFRQSSPIKYSSVFKNYCFIGSFVNVKILDGHINTEAVSDWAAEMAQNIPTAVQIEKISLSTEKVFQKQNGTKQDSLIGVWDVSTLRKFLEINPVSVIPKARDRHFFFLLSPQACARLPEIARNFWALYGVAEAVMFCSNCAFVYRPFRQFAENYTMGEISQNLTLLIENSLHDFHGYSLNVSLFDAGSGAFSYMPRFLQAYSMYQHPFQSIGYMGPDALFLATLSRILNFKPIIVATMKTSSDFVQSYKDVAIENADLTMPHEQIDVCAVVPKSLKIAKTPFAYQNFDQLTQILFGLTVAASVTFWYMANGSFTDALTKTFCFILGFPRKLPPSIKHFFYMFACLAVNNIILVILLGLVFKNLTTIDYEKDINTLDELVESRLPIVSHYWRYIDGDHMWQKLFRMKYTPADDLQLNRYETIAHNRNLATLDFLSAIKENIKQSTMKNHGEPLLHLVPQCIMSIFQVIMVQKGSPLLDVFNPIILSTNEAGLINKWKKDVNHARFLEQIANLTQKTSVYQALSVDDLSKSFYVIGIGNGLATLLFLGELVFHCIHTF